MSALLVTASAIGLALLVDGFWLRERLSASLERERAAEFLLGRAADDCDDLLGKLADARAETARISAQAERVVVERDAAAMQGEHAVTLLCNTLTRERAEREAAHAASLASIGATLAWPLVIANGELRAEVGRLRAAVEAGDRIDVALRELVGEQP